MQKLKLSTIPPEIKRIIKKDEKCFTHENKIKLIKNLLINHYYNISLLNLQKKYNDSNYSAVLKSTNEKIFLRSNKSNDLTIAETFNGIIVNHFDPFNITLKIIGITKIGENYFCMYAMPEAYVLKSAYDSLKTYHMDNETYYTFENVDLYVKNMKEKFINFIEYFKKLRIEFHNIDKNRIIFNINHFFIFDFSKCTLFYDEIKFDFFPSLKNEHFMDDIFNYINQEIEYFKFLDTIGV